MSLLLDTQRATWWQIAPQRLPASCVDAVQGSEGDVFVSRASLWEKDPFDRLLAAKNRSEPLILLTTDAKLSRCGSTMCVL